MSEKGDSKKYVDLDPVLQEVTKERITLSDKDINIYNEQLKKVVNAVLKEMKENDGIFKCLYQKETYTGSFYENLRISKPDEFDINLIILLPTSDFQILQDSTQPGFVKIKIKQWDKGKLAKIFNKVPNGEATLERWIDKKHYLSRSRFLHWMQGVVQKAVNKIELPGTKIKQSQSGPALTLIVSQPQRAMSEFSVDLVPVFEFGKDKWPSPPVRKHPAGICEEWCVVPKAPASADEATIDTFWRISFYKQEREIMNGLHSMKHIIKLMKLFRDHLKWPVSSYAIKTMFLWEHEKQKNKDFWKQSIGFLFMHMLKQFYDYLDKGKIPFYWDSRHNVLNITNSVTLLNMKGCINKALGKVDRQLEMKPYFIKIYFGYSLDQCDNSSSGDEKSESKLLKSSFQSDIIHAEKTEEAVLIDFGNDANSDQIKKNEEEDCARGPNEIILQFSDEIQQLRSEVQNLKLHQKQIEEDLKQYQNIVQKLQEENAFFRKFISNGSNDHNANLMDSDVPSTVQPPRELFSLQSHSEVSLLKDLINL